MRKIVLYICFFCLSINSFAQRSARITNSEFSTNSSDKTQNHKLEFKATVNNQPIIQEKKYFLQSLSDSISFEVIRFYISNIQLFRGDRQIRALNKKHHLIDLENLGSLNIDLEILDTMKFDKIKFNLGIDSLTNVSGAFGGDLDPTNGMYWTWQSGYINFKLEGISPSCPARKNFFQFHLGGYQTPFASLQKVELNIFDQKRLTIILPIDQLLKKINLKTNYQIMAPSQQSDDMSQLIASLFFIAK